MTANKSQTGTVVVINQTSKKQRHSMITWVMAVAMVAVLGVGGTFAYLTYATNQATNHLTTSTGLQAQLTETEWDKALKTNENYGQNMVPGTTVDKNPQITNTSTSDISEWAAVEVEFQKSDGNGGYVTMSAADLEAFFKVYSIYSGATAPTAAATDIAVNSSWTAMTNTTQDGKRFYYYNSALAKGDATDALFDHVAILSSATQADITALNDLFTDWQIVVKGAAVQNIQGDTGAAAFDKGVSSTDTPNWYTLLEASPTTTTTTGN